jgi:uncharacterized protein involved in exopolysaccharide biosynthesis
MNSTTEAEPVEHFELLASDSPLELIEQRWRTLALAALGGVLVGGIAAMGLPAWYQSNERLVVVPLEDPSGPTGGAIDQANATLPIVVSVLRSRRVADETVEHLRLASAWKLTPPAARRRVMAGLTVTTDRKANLVMVSFEDRAPRRARDVLATLTERATKACEELWQARNHEHRLTLETELAQVNLQLTRAEEEMRDFRERTHVVDLPTQIKASVEEAVALERLRISKALDAHFAVAFGGHEAVEVQRAIREREAAEHELQLLRHNEGRRRIGPLLALSHLPELELEHARLKRAVDTLAAQRELLTLKVGQLKAAEARPGGRAEVIDAASEPVGRAGPSIVRFALGGALLGALAAALLVVYRRRLGFAHGRR